MRQLQHVLFDISAHGLGHLAQSAPVIAALHRRLPSTRITVRCGLSREVLARRIAAPFEHMPTEEDFGLLMRDPFTVDIERTEGRYLRLHEHLDSVLDRLAEGFERAGVDLVLSDVGYLSLGAAQRCGIANFVFSSINWYDVVSHYCADGEGMDEVLSDMAAIYRHCGAILRLVPGLEMSNFETVPIDRVMVARGQDRRDELLRRLGLGGDTLLVTFSFSENDGTQAPSVEAHNADAVALICPSGWKREGRPWISFAEADMPFIDLVWSCDLVVAKPGYGILTEAAVADTPAIMVARNGWPESAANAAWKQQYGRFEDASGPLHEMTLPQIREAAGRLSRKCDVRVPKCGGEEAILDIALGAGIRGRAAEQSRLGPAETGPKEEVNSNPRCKLH